jgi:pimeloyl-ACP methyl ester carboxylesterase
MSIRFLILLFVLLGILLLSFLFSDTFEFSIGILILGFLLLLVILKLYDNYKISKRKIIFTSFSEIEELGCFKDTQPIFHTGETRVEHAVLLIHGFSASVNEFKLLSKKLKENKIPFYAPMLTGFGLDEYHLLKNIRAKDWLRDVVNAYDLLDNFAENVSVVGHSMGGLLALYLASSKRINKLILTAPYLVHKKSHSLMKYLLRFIEL